MDSRTRRAELIERDGLLEAFAAAPKDVASALGLSRGLFNGLGAIASAAVPVTDFNRIVAVGAEAPASADDLSAALAWLDENDACGWAIQIGPAATTPAVVEWLAAHHLAPSGNGWAKFVLSPTGSPPPRRDLDGLTVRLVDATTADVFGRVMQMGFGAPPATRDWFAAIGRWPMWRAYLAYVGQEPVGVGSMFVKDGAAWLNSATTLPDHRGRGVQSALVAARIADAASVGVTLLTGETGFPSAGGDFPSYRNYVRAGFHLAYVRPNYRPEQPSAGRENRPT